MYGIKVFVVCFKICRWCRVVNEGEFFVFFENGGFCEKFTNSILRDQLLNQFQNYKFQDPIF